MWSDPKFDLEKEILPHPDRKAWLGFLYAGLSYYKTLLSSRPSDSPAGGERLERSHCASLRGIKEEPCDGDYLKQRSKGLLPITGRFRCAGKR
jgi:hypothetical protein